MWVVRVRHHKTQITGSANLLLPEILMKQMNYYLNVLRPLRLGTTETNRFFLGHGGKEMDHMARRVEALSKRFKFTFVNSTEMRKVVATEATKNLEPTKRNLLAKQLSHSSTVENHHYNLDLHTTKAAAEAYELVQAAAEAQHLVPPEVSSSTSPSTSATPKPARKRVFFTMQETKQIEDYFSDVIQRGGTIKMDRAEVFVAEKSITARTAKQIVDKVRNLSNYYKDC